MKSASDAATCDDRALHDAWGKADVRVGRGALALERALLAELCAELEAATREPARLARPLRVVVPSRSLREHLCARLVAEAERPLLGVRVQTLHATALEILGESETPQGELLFPVFAERAARAEPALRRPLDGLDDAFGVVTASLSDLLDAGLEPDCADALLGAAGPKRGRTAALVRSALAVQDALRHAGLRRPGDLLAAAARELDSRGAAALPNRGIAIHGFADATGRALDLLEALVCRCGARAFLDAPPRTGSGEPDLRFTQRLRERLEAASGAASVELPHALPAAELELLRAPGAQAECRAVASRIRALLDRGAVPERIGVVARSLAPYTTTLRAQLSRLGVPFSGCGQAGPLPPAGRRLRGLAELWRRGTELPVDRWLDLVGGARELSVALHTLGAGRLGDVAALDVGGALGAGARLALPLRRGIDDSDDGPRARRRYVSRERLEAAAERAKALLATLDRARGEGRAGAQLRELRSLGHSLGWQGTDRAAFETLVAELEAGLPPDAELEAGEFGRVLAARAPEVAASALGGEGGGVQVLDLGEARARSFDHLFAIGLERDVFPRSVVEDPLLPDALRRPLRDVLPDLPLKQRGHAEEAYLFAQLLSSSPRVTLSWQRVDDDGRPRAASPFVERLRLPSSEVPSLWEPHAPDDPRPALEHLVLAGLHGSRRGFARALEVVLPPDLAHARFAALEELDPDAAGAARIGPFFGLLGPQSAGRVFVTRLEDTARCGWQAFLRRVLRIEPLPDALESLPAIDARMLGNAVHRVLERIVREHDEGLVDWPAEDVLERLLRESAREVLRDAGVGFAAFERLLVERARPFVHAARARIWGDAASLWLLGSEVEGEHRLPSGHRLGFRADLVEARADGRCLIDVKTGRSISQAKRESTRRAHFEAEIARGARLQAPLYQLGGGPGAVGSYVFLDPEIDDAHAVFSVGPDDELLLDAAHDALEVLLKAWEAGAFAPRLVDARGDEPPACRFCELAEACLRGDSGARARLSGWLESGSPESEAESRLRSVLRLGEGAS